MDMAQMALKAVDARRVGDEATAEYWSLRVQYESDKAERDALLAEWDQLKGSPEHG